MKRNQDRVLENASPTRTVPQPQTPAPPRNPRSETTQAILDYEGVIYEAIAMIDMVIATFVEKGDDHPITKSELDADNRASGCYLLADGVKTRLYTGFHRIAKASQEDSQHA